MEWSVEDIWRIMYVYGHNDVYMYAEKIFYESCSGFPGALRPLDAKTISWSGPRCSGSRFDGCSGGTLQTTHRAAD